ncbi:MAG TPA: HD domain-containing phosphohydrolase [Bryobacteraceae bacterium]|jgi:diguanylate cyclase (GGDEF)-like protein/putative nucleotidyltransferase with HDIG domain|nr:HD domain-containing phosphohydrolase [Bryobacteraceae bacterium]
MPTRARIYIALILAGGIIGVGAQLAHFSSAHPLQFWCYFLTTILTSGLKIRLPMVFATLSVNFLFILVGIVQFSLPEAIVLGVAGTVVQCLWRPRSRPKAIRIAFSACSIALAVIAAHAVFHGPLLRMMGELHPLLLGLAATTYFVVNTVLVAGVIALTERKSVYKTWYQTYFWILPYHLAAASVGWLMVVLTKQDSWHAALVLFPLVYFVYRSYKMYLERLENAKTHVEEIAGLHLRTIEALALAIEAKDSTTADHLQRVRVYATEIGKEIGLSQTELDALQASALLHDIGKLAVPEHIISKPGRLTPEEFEKMKIHPLVGAEILEEVKFPYPVVPIVRAHHEKWDGSGYPFGLAGEEIPIGARILSVVDCLDALASDRQYRRALPLDQAMEIVSSESGKSFDPVIVDIMRRRYIELERMAAASGAEKEKIKLSMDVKVERGLAPATGFAESADEVVSGLDSGDPLSSIAAATQEAQMLYELTQDLGNLLSLQEALAFVGVRMKRLIPYETIAVYIRRDDKLMPEYVSGENLRLFTALEIPMGQGLSGWVAENNKPLLNGNPSVEAGYLNDASKYSTLRAALAVPLSGVNGLLGVMALYRAERDSFSKENLRILLAISPKVALAVETALTHRLLETSITTDYLTSLPNARSLFLSLDNELARAQRTGSSLAVIVCDLDGFKAVNDRFGHLAGNKVLRLIANGLREQCSPPDYVARMGGDEFVLLIPGAKGEELDLKIERLRTVAKRAGDTTPEPSILSMSVGVATYPDDGSDAEDLLAEADRRMYKSKRLRKKSAPVVAAEPSQVPAAAV